MTDDDLRIEPSADERASDRREFFRGAFGATAAAVLGVGAVTVASRAFADTTTDVDTLNFVLTLKYLEAQFFNNAAFGTGLPAGQISGTGTAGQATGARQVNFTDTTLQQIVAEIAQDKAAHVAWLRGELGAGAVAQPAIDLSATAGGAFSTAMGAAGVVAKGSAFDPYASDGNFLLAAFLLEDVVVSSHLGTISSVTDKTHLTALTNLAFTDANHAATIRGQLYAKGAATGSLRSNADLISNLRDNLDGTTDDDQGVSPMTVNGATVSNAIPAAADGGGFGRIAGGVLNVFYLNSASVTKGGFFPSGINGNITASTSN